MLIHANCFGAIIVDLSNMFKIFSVCNITTRNIQASELKIDCMEGKRVDKLICSKCGETITSIEELGADCAACGKFYLLKDLLVQIGTSSPFYCLPHSIRLKKTNDVEFRSPFKDLTLEKLILGSSFIGGQ
jgi:hypothetical protein